MLHTCGCLQGKSHLLVMHVICGSFSATTWTDTRGFTAEKSRTSVIAAIRSVSISSGLPKCSTRTLAVHSSAALPETRNFLCLAAELLTDRQTAKTPTAVYRWDKQRGKPVLPGCICSSSLLESPTVF